MHSSHRCRMCGVGPTILHPPHALTNDPSIGASDHQVVERNTLRDKRTDRLPHVIRVEPTESPCENSSRSKTAGRTSSGG